MLYKKIFCGSFTVLLLITGSCFEGDDGNPSPVDTSSKSSGTFLVTLENQNGRDKAIGSGKVYDGPIPPDKIWEEVASEGGCKLFQPRNPFCETPCGFGYVCVGNDSCQPEPSVISVGAVTVSGLKTKSGLTNFTMEPLIPYNDYQPTENLFYPPFSEGDNITFTAAGTPTMPAFTLKAYGISPLVVLNDTIELADDKPIDLKWVPPTIPGNTKIYVLIDLSYHGGTKAKIECECEDNGSLTIPSSLLKKLTNYGISGYPKIEVVRRSVGINESLKVKLVIESKILKYLKIPGVYSCGDGVCPDGMTCGGDQRCIPN